MLTRRTLLTSAAAAAAAVPLLPSAAWAKAAKAKAQNAGVYRWTVGDIQVSALLDGYFDLDAKLFEGAGADAQGIAGLLALSPQAKPLRAAVNAFAVNTGDKLVLIDTGGGAAMGPTVGSLAANLKAAGMDPSDVDAVLITHIHPDHVNGLVGAEGKAAFPNAEIIVSEADFKFWTPPEAGNAAPAEAKPLFEAARNAMAPYTGKVTQFAGEKEVVKGITSVPLPGHTVGHTGFRIASGKSQLLVWGDIVHAASLQFLHPEWSIAFDTDRALAVETRKKIFDQVATDRTPVVGAHLPFPGHGYVLKTARGYGFATAMWDPEL
jgi:glyoxylase-like metal-dependent hydrolase (beta-lactamase superfamily II)